MSSRDFPPHPRACSAHVQGRGFTLIEMMVVLGIIGAMLGLSTLALGVLTSTSLSSSTRNFADFVNSCRSEAIAKHTAVRVGIVVNKEGDIRRYSSWACNRKGRKFEQVSAWDSLAGDVKFERSSPKYLRGAPYATRDASSVRGDYLLGNRQNIFTVNDWDDKEVDIAYFQFTPSGRVEAPGADLRNLILVLRPSNQAKEKAPSNWSQINLDTLTGRYRVYRP